MAIKSFSISWSAPITKIKCDGVEGCPESPYLNSVTIELVCQPGATDCLGTYYCVDQTNTCNPNPCSP